VTALLLPLGLFLARRWAADLQGRRDASTGAGSSTLECGVAGHGDPARVTDALEEDGYVVSVDLHAPGCCACRSGPAPTEEGAGPRRDRGRGLRAARHEDEV
jgi:hypothetical protein